MKLAQLEKDLNLCQEKVLESARQRIDAMNEEANRLKMNILREAQAQSQSKVEEITDQVAQVSRHRYHSNRNFIFPMFIFSWEQKMRVVV